MLQCTCYGCWSSVPSYADTKENGKIKSLGQLPNIVRQVSELRQLVASWRAQRDTVSLVPTMGALHAGHMALVAEAAKLGTRTVASIFVNPTQFAPSEDLDAYPTTWNDDIAKLRAVACDAVWAPTKSEMYADGFSTKIVPGGPADGLETDHRAHFFGGVATVCAKLFLQCLPDYALFGEKDYQQLLVVRQIVSDLNIPVEIIAIPTVRDADGLAMSSRNAYLSAEERARAPHLFQTIRQVADDIKEGSSIDQARKVGRQSLSAAGFKVDYLDVRSAKDLTPMDDPLSNPARILVAARLGTTRLIDNVALTP